MMEGRQHHRNCNKSWRVAVVCLAVAAFIPLAWFALAADSRVNLSPPMATKFQCARLRYPGGISDYIKNWYTDYPAMDIHLTRLLGRLTGIDVAPPMLVDPSSPIIFDYPIIYTVEPEQMVLRPSDVSN